jgi:hypothetical protein
MERLPTLAGSRRRQHSDAERATGDRNILSGLNTTNLKELGDWPFVVNDLPHDEISAASCGEDRPLCKQPIRVHV